MLLSRKPDASAAKAELKRNLIVLGVWLAAIRAAPYILHATQRTN